LCGCYSVPATVLRIWRNLPNKILCGRVCDVGGTRRSGSRGPRRTVAAPKTCCGLQL